MNRGHDVEIFADIRGDIQKIHPAVLEYRLLQRTHYKVAVPRNLFKRLWKATWFIIVNIHKKPLVILRCLNVLKYGRQAASLRLLYEVLPYVNCKKFDIIQCHFGPNGILGIKLREIGALRGKLVTMFHGYDIRLGLKSEAIYKKLFKQGDCFLAISNYNYSNLMHFGADPQKVIRHPVGIDINSYPFRWQNSCLKPETTIIITVARLVEEKGLKYGIHAIHRLLMRNPKLKLKYNIIGDGELKEQLQRQVNEFALDNSVNFLGALDQEEIKKQLQKAHIFLLPSVAEALPVSLMEAQATGLPIVASHVGSVHESILNGKSGFLVPERDIDAFAEKLQYLIENPKIWPQMGQAGRAHMQANYYINKLNDRLDEIYEKLLDNS